MSQGWERERWRLDEARARRLPQVDDLPRTGDGYDRAAVEAAFDAFYRHAAEMDRTLEVLESVAAFQREAGALRADIRALRAASWGPVPTLRHTVATTAAGRVERGPAVLQAWPRIALYSAFIIFVAVGSAVADLSSGAIVALVLASWLVVGVAELAVSGLGSRFGSARGYPAWAAEQPEAPAAAEPAVVQAVAAPASEPEEVAEPDEVAEPEQVAELEAADEEPEPEALPAWRPWTRPGEPEAEAEPEAGEAPADEAEEAEEAAAEAQPEFVPELEPFGQPPEGAEQQPAEIVPEVEPFGEPAAEEPAEQALAAEVEEAEEARGDASEAVELEAEPLEADALADEPGTEEPEAPDGEAEELEAEELGAEQPVAEAPAAEPMPAHEPERPRRLRFWRRRPAEEQAAALVPLPEPRHVRLVDVEDDAEEPEDVPVGVAEPEPPAAAEVGAGLEAEPDPEPEPAPEPEAEPELQSASEGEPGPDDVEPEASEPAEEHLEDTGVQPVAFAPPPAQPLRLRRGRR